jgi:hypothetical protein
MRSVLYRFEDAVANERKKAKEASESAKKRKRSEDIYVPRI